MVDHFCKTNKISKSTFYMSIIAIYIHKKTNLTNFFLSAANRNRRKTKENLMAGLLTKSSYFIVNIKNEKFVNFTKNIRLSLKAGYEHMNYIYNYRSELFNRFNDNRLVPSNVFLSYQNLEVNTDMMNINFEVEGDNNAGMYGAKDNVKLIYDYLKEKYSVEEIRNINNSVIDIIKQVSNDNKINIQDIKV